MKKQTPKRNNKGKFIKQGNLVSDDIFIPNHSGQLDAGKILNTPVNGTDVTNSNTIYCFKTTGTAGLTSVTFIQHFNTGDYFEFWTWGDSTNNQWEATAAGTTPTRPACPSIIITANFIESD